MLSFVPRVTPTSPLPYPHTDAFAGMVLVGGGRGAKKGGGPGPLPRYGDAGGAHYMVAEAACRELAGIGRAKIKVRGRVQSCCPASLHMCLV